MHFRNDRLFSCRTSCCFGRVLMRECGEGERWAGLWDFPRFALEAEGLLFARDEIVIKVREQTGIKCSAGALIKTIKHGVTRYRITLDCYEDKYIAGRAKIARWIMHSELTDLPLSTTGRRITRLLAT